jgi:hypothetical protein
MSSSLPTHPRGYMFGTLAAKEPRYVHLTVYSPTGFTDDTFEKLKNAIDELSQDWVKYSRESWILYTTETPKSLYEKILVRVPDIATNTIFAFYFDPTAPNGGQQLQFVWDWLNKRR